MINEIAITPDKINDLPRNFLDAMNKEKGWTSIKSRLRDELAEYLNSNGYITFEGSPYRYLISQVGESYLYDVPLYKQGYLKRFRGKRVRIVCIGSGRYKRTLMAGAVGDTPKELIVEKLKYTYTFPSYATQSEAIYRTRRFLLFKAEKSLKIQCDKEPNGYVDLQDWDSVLIDGRKGIPIAKARRTLEGSVEIRQMGWLGQHHSPDYRDAVKYITKWMV